VSVTEVAEHLYSYSDNLHIVPVVTNDMSMKLSSEEKTRLYKELLDFWIEKWQGGEKTFADVIPVGLQGKMYDHICVDATKRLTVYPTGDSYPCFQAKKRYSFSATYTIKITKRNI